MTGEDYYSPHPRRQLSRPLAVTGQLGSGVASVARGVAARTGLPFVELERLVEARIGSTRALLAHQKGFGALRAEEESALLRALRDRPPPILSIEGAMPTGQTMLDMLHESASVVYVRHPEEELLARIQSCRRQSPARYPEFMISAPCSLEALAPFLAQRSDALERAHAFVDAGGLHAHRIAELLLDSLDRFC